MNTSSVSYWTIIGINSNSPSTSSNSNVNILPFSQLNILLIKSWKFQLNTISHCFDITDITF